MSGGHGEVKRCVVIKGQAQLTKTKEANGYKVIHHITAISVKTGARVSAWPLLPLIVLRERELSAKPAINKVFHDLCVS